MSKLKILLVDDHQIVRLGLKTLIDDKPNMQVVGEGTNGAEAVHLAEQYHPDVVLLDLVMPEMNGVDAIRRITSAYPSARILVMTSFAADDKVFPSIKAGAHFSPSTRTTWRAKATPCWL